MPQPRHSRWSVCNVCRRFCAAVMTSSTLTTERRRIRLDKGTYRLRLDYRNNVAGACLRVGWGRDVRTLEPLAAPALLH